MSQNKYIFNNLDFFCKKYKQKFFTNNCKFQKPIIFFRDIKSNFQYNLFLLTREGPRLLIFVLEKNYFYNIYFM
jgi:hypothetical protein